MRSYDVHMFCTYCAAVTVHNVELELINIKPLPMEIAQFANSPNMLFVGLI